MKYQSYFLFTRNDLLEKLDQLVSELDVKYFELDMLVDRTNFGIYNSAKDIDLHLHLGVLDRSGDMYEKRIVVVQKTQELLYTSLGRNDGTTAYNLDLLKMPYCQLCLGGVYQEKYLIAGEIGRPRYYMSDEIENQTDEIYNLVAKIFKKGSYKYNSSLVIGQDAKQQHLEGKLYLVPGGVYNPYRTEDYIYLEGAKIEKAVNKIKEAILEDKGEAIYDKSNNKFIYLIDLRLGLSELPKEYEVYEPGTNLENMSTERLLDPNSVILFNPQWGKGKKANKTLRQLLDEFKK